MTLVEGIVGDQDNARRQGLSPSRLLSQKEALHEPDEAHQGDGARGGLDRASLPARAPHPDEDRQEQGDHERLTGFHAEVEAEERQCQVADRQMERAQGGRETEAVDEAEEEADEPAQGRHVAEEDVLEGHVDDGRGDDALNEPLGHGDEAEDSQGQRDAVGDGEGSDDLEERQEAASAEQQGPEEEEVVVAGEDVLDAELEEACLRATGVASPDRDSCLARLRSEGQLPRLPVGLDLCQRVVVRAEDVEDVVLYDEIPHRAPAYASGRVGASHYCASKAGVVMFTRVLAMELAEQRINVNCIAPGYIKVDSGTSPLTSDFETALMKNTPWRRLGTPADIAPAALFLASPAADYVTGEVLAVNGGAMAGRMYLPLSTPKAR